jgi:Putative endonuclease segE, GIY-YIG domain/NUMOD3 motif
VRPSATQWLYNGQPFETAPENAFGFVYCISNLSTGQKYIGKKQFWSYLTKKVKGRKNRVHYQKESDWKKYWSSCAELKEDVQQIGAANFVREIVEIYKSKGELTYGEIEHQIKLNVLKATLPSGRQAYYNRNIMNRWFVPPTTVSEETRQRQSAAMKGRSISEEHRQHISEGKQNISAETRHKLSIAAKRRERFPLSPEHRRHISEALMGHASHSPSEDVKSKISKSLMGNIPWNKGLKTGKGGPKGQKFTPEQCRRISEAHKGQIPWNKGSKIIT